MYISPEFSSPVDHLIKKMLRNATGLRSSSFIFGRQSSLRQTNLLLLLLLLYENGHSCPLYIPSYLHRRL